MEEHEVINIDIDGVPESNGPDNSLMDLEMEDKIVEDCEDEVEDDTLVAIEVENIIVDEINVGKIPEDDGVIDECDSNGDDTAIEAAIAILKTKRILIKERDNAPLNMSKSTKGLCKCKPDQQF